MSSLSAGVTCYFTGCNCSRTGLFLPSLQYLHLRDLAENLYSVVLHQVLLIIIFIFPEKCFRICIRMMTLWFPFAFWSMYDADLGFISMAVTQCGPFLAISRHRIPLYRLLYNERSTLLMEFRTCYAKRIVLWHIEYFKQKENGKYKKGSPEADRA